MKLLFNLAYRNLVGAGLRTWLNVIVLSFTFIVIIWHKGILDGWDRQARTDMINWETGGGQYWQKNYDPYDPFTLTESHAILPQDFKSLIEKSELVPILITQGTFYPGGRIQSILIRGIDTAQKILKIPTALFPKNYDVIPALIGSRMAADNQIRQGDLITMRWRDVNGTFDAEEIKVTSIFETNVPTIDIGQVWIPLEKLQQMLQMQGEATMFVRKNAESVIPVPEGWVFKGNDFLLKSITDIIRIKSTSGVVLYLILLSLAMLAVFDTQILSIFRRQREIGTYVALGMTRWQVVGLFTLEGSLNSVLAIVLAAIYGIPLLTLQAVKGLSFANISKGYGLTMADKIFPVYSLGLIVTTIVLIMITTTIVSYLPSRKIAKMKPTDALRGKLQ